MTYCRSVIDSCSKPFLSFFLLLFSFFFFVCLFFVCLFVYFLVIVYQISQWHLMSKYDNKYIDKINKQINKCQINILKYASKDNDIYRCVQS